jgi:hypothetical protein
LTEASAGETFIRLYGFDEPAMERGAVMDWRLISTVAPVGVSLGLMTLGASTAGAADVVKPKRDVPGQMQCLKVSELPDTEKGKLRIAMRRGTGAEHSAPRMALVLGVAF